jgi:glycosyltransferase involved in cell wall biosynthesis
MSDSANGHRPLSILFEVSRWGDDPRAAGGDVQGALYARLLARLGHEVTYLTSSYSGAPRHRQVDGVDVIRIGQPETLAARMWSYYRNHASSFDLVYTEAFGGARVPFCAPLYVRQPMLTAWYQLNTPVFRQQYGRAASVALGALEKLVARIHRRTTLITPSRARRADLIAFGFRPERVEVIPPFALTPDYEPTPISGREPLIIWLGKLRRYKCVHDAIAAMPYVLRACPSARLVIAGRRDDAGYENELREQVKRLSLRDSVSFAFDLSETAKRELLRSARVMVLPSPIEGFGIVLLEAAAEGTPSVVSDGIPVEVIEQGYNGLRVPFGDTEALGNALAQVITSRDLHDRLAAGAITRAQTYTESSLAARLQSVVSEAVFGAPARTLVPAC